MNGGWDILKKLSEGEDEMKDCCAIARLLAIA
jgi:hypothetical protein